MHRSVLPAIFVALSFRTCSNRCSLVVRVDVDSNSNLRSVSLGRLSSHHCGFTHSVRGDAAKLAIMVTAAEVRDAQSTTAHMESKAASTDSCARSSAGVGRLRIVLYCSVGLVAVFSAVVASTSSCSHSSDLGDGAPRSLNADSNVLQLSRVCLTSVGPPTMVHSPAYPSHFLSGGGHTRKPLALWRVESCLLAPGAAGTSEPTPSSPCLTA